jgi:hypothetical protein
MRRDKHKLGKQPSKHSQSLQKKAKDVKLGAKLMKKMSPKTGSMDVESQNEPKTPEQKEADRIARKKLNASKVSVYKKLNSSITNTHGHRAVR